MSAIAVAGTPIEWYLDGDTWRPRPLVFSGELTVTEDEIDTSRFAWEKQKFSSSVMALSVDQAWREANGEDVGSGEGYVESDDNDRPCALLLHPLDVASLHEHPHDLWGTFLTVSHEQTLKSSR